MSCSRCGGNCQGQYCRDCEREISQGIRAGEEPTQLGVPMVEDDANDSGWRVRQTGLGDRDAAGQTTLDGGIATTTSEGGDDG